MDARPMTENCDCDQTIEREIWTRSYLRALEAEIPEAAAAVADRAVALFESRWRFGTASETEIRRANSVIAAGLVSGKRLKDFRSS